MAKKFTLGKSERLKSRKQIEQLFKNGQRFVIPPFRVFFSFQAGQQSSDFSPLQAGFGASSRNFKTAVERNRIKRLAREAYRLQKNILYDKLKEQERKLNVFFIYTGKELPDFTTVKDKVAVALKKLADKIDENIPKNS